MQKRFATWPAQIVLLIGLLTLWCFSSFSTTRKRSQENCKVLNKSNSNNFLDGCLHVFIDAGANRGVQIRKLFQPGLFPGAAILAHFEDVFGADADSDAVCAVAFEPNPAHAEELSALERHFSAECGRRVFVFAGTAVGGREDGKAWFVAPQNDEEGFALGGKVIVVQDSESSSSLSSATPVKTTRLSRFILETVATRRLPPEDGVGSVLLKLDVEGAELEVMADLIATGAAGRLRRILVEWHDQDHDDEDEGEEEDRPRFTRGLRKAAEIISYLSRALELPDRVDVVAFDDESYFDQQISLVGCN